MKNFFEYELYIFDLDNTLYPEQEYLWGGYDAIGTMLGDKRIAAFLKKVFAEQGRGLLFDKMVKEFSLDHSVIDRSLETLRGFSPATSLSLYPDMGALLPRLKGLGKKLAILTNGNVHQQKNKVNHIAPDLTGIFDLIVYANELASKPSPKGIELIMERFNIGKSDTLMIGDDISDETAARNAGIDFTTRQGIK